MEIVGNEWQEMGIFSPDTSEIAYRASNSGALILDQDEGPQFQVAVINTEDKLTTFHLKELRVNMIELMRFKVKSNH